MPVENWPDAMKSLWKIFSDRGPRGLTVWDSSYSTRPGLRHLRPNSLLIRSGLVLVGALVFSFFAAAFLSRNPEGERSPLTIGVLALGPRYEPNWRCGDPDYLPGPAKRTETSPFYVHGLLDGLRKLKYVNDPHEEGVRSTRHFSLDVRTGTTDELKQAANDFASKRVDVIVAIATATVTIARDATRGHAIPILMTGVSQPVDEGFVQSLAHPGGSITGVSHQLTQGSGKRVELFKQIHPNLNKLITIRRIGYTVSEHSMSEVRAAADRLKIQVDDFEITNREELRTILRNLKPERSSGILISPDSLIISNLDLILETSLARRVPTFGLQDYMADWGAVAAYGPSAFEAGNRVARYVDKISKGARAADLPVEPIDPTFIVNLKVAKCLEVSPSTGLLQQANRVVEPQLD
jgi:putative tryptophan/tyrosine transport system substrate-binding protein